MAQQEAINIKVTVDSKDAQQGVDKLQEGVKQTGDAAKKAEAGAKKAAGAFSTIGNALKSLGIISLVVRGLEFLQEILMKNQKVADAFAVAGEFISRVLSDLVEFVVNNFGKVVDLFTKVFNDPLLYVEKLGEAIKNNLIERVKSLIDAYGFLGEIIKNVFTGEFDAAAEAAKNFGKEVVDVFTGVDDAFDKGVEVVKNATAAIVEYGKETLEAAKKGVELRNSARLAASEAEKQAAIFKRQAEEQRQIRDNEFASIQDRIEANQKLGKILADQLKSELIAAELAVASAQYEKDKNNNLDNQIALNQALTALEGKREEITGQRSEQLANEVALRKELLDINKSQTESDIKLELDARKAAANRIKDEKVKLQTLREIAVDEAAIELKRLQDNIQTQKDATKAVYDQQETLARQALENREITESEFNKKLKEINAQRVDADKETNAARVAAEIEYKDKKAAIANEIIAIDENIEKVTIDREMAAAERQIADAEKLQEDIFRQFDIKRDAYDQEQALLQESLDKNLISQQEFNDKYKALSDARIRIDEEEKQARINAAMAAADVLGKLASIIGEQTAAGKALGIAQATINTYTGATQALNSKVLAPEPFATAIRVAQAAVIVASGIKSIREIAKVKVQGQAGSGGVSLPSLSAAAPITPQAALPTVTQLDNQTINRMGSATNRAYVLESDINNNQERLIRITRAARLG
jgi:hypothetical protein